MSGTPASGWQFWIDRGGTFTDIVARRPDGQLRALKLLSENPGRYPDAAVAGVRDFLADSGTSAPIEAVRMGTTVGTNALLERRGEPTTLVITGGLRDAIRIGTQQRPDIFALNIEMPEMLYESVIEARERLSAAGEVIVPLDEKRLGDDLAAARSRGIASVAIVLLHAYRNPEHEERAAALAEQAGFEQISVSHRASPLIRLVNRGNTTLVDAYLSPVLRRYVRQVRDGIEEMSTRCPLLFMQSHGGLTEARRFEGKDCVLSGPAGGVVGMVAAASNAGFERVIGFDMGGTSTDVSLYDGEFERTTDALIAGFRIAAPMLRIHTVAAGGGSILEFADGRLQVGPASAGAWPGPLCYRNGGPLTVTDANLLLGRIQADYFPRVFGRDGRQPLDTAGVRAAFEALARTVPRGTATSTPEEVAAGFIRVAVERMANAIKQISIQRGYDAAQFALCCFGGAAGQHACQVADALGIRTVLVPGLAGVLSAYGMGVADIRAIRQRTVEATLDTAGYRRAQAMQSELRAAAHAEVSAQRVADADIGFEARLLVKTRGADSALPIAWTDRMGVEDCRAAFEAVHHRHFGFAPTSSDLVIDSIDVEAVGRMPSHALPEPPAADGPAKRATVRRVWLGNGWVDTPVYERSAQVSGVAIQGPAIIVEANATTVVQPDWSATIAGDDIVLSRVRERASTERVATGRDPMMLEVFNNLFMHIAEEMGTILVNTAHSVNIKERADFSCAIFDPDGELIANAPHIPVHLGSMGESVKAILTSAGGSLAPGDVYMLNDPYRGGTHLPDITVVSGVFDETGRELRFVVANRAHHADIGGITPGSMPADSRSIAEEGVVFGPFLLVHEGRFRERELLEALSGGAFPARNPAQNLLDLKAQIAANVRGAAGLSAMVKRFGLEVVTAYMGHIKQNAEESVRAAIAALEAGRFRVELDGGECICVTVSRDAATRDATIDFTGSSATSPGNFNAPSAVARAVVLYVFRTLVQQAIPLNEGCLKPLAIQLPKATIVNPEHPAAVVAGNVETSQCIADALLAAVGACAAAQGTMNNFTFGNEKHQYYETICGGAGAGPNFDGASAVHTHMTNSRMTDPEVLEWRHPVRLRRFEIREHSGGAGRHRGGDGIVRELEFLEPMQATILSNRRRTAPFGLAGGAPGTVGRNCVVRASGAREELPATASVRLEAGDRFVIETPGGGGYGPADPDG